MEQKPILKACAAVGGVSALAGLLRVTPPTVSQWISGRRQITALRCPAIELATGVPCEQLRPDVQWGLLRGTAENADVAGEPSAAPGARAA
jgi:DNA-binding transcriptional regulator YdaS (Cro superfamily)